MARLSLEDVSKTHTHAHVFEGWGGPEYLWAFEEERPSRGGMDGLHASPLWPNSRGHPRCECPWIKKVYSVDARRAPQSSESHQKSGPRGTFQRPPFLFIPSQYFCTVVNMGRTNSRL